MVLLVPAGLGCDHRVGHLGLPLGHHQEEDDDDGGAGSEVLQQLGLCKGGRVGPHKSHKSIDYTFTYNGFFNIFLCD